MSDIGAKIHEKLDDLQFGEQSRFIVIRPAPIGLGGQITGRVVGLILAVAMERKAIFVSLDDPPYRQTFAPLHDGAPEGITDDGAPVVHDLEQNDAVVMVYDPLRTSIGSRIHEKDVSEKIASVLKSDETDPLLVQGAIRRWMKITDSMADYCAAAEARLGVGLETLGVHFRRGDKQVESAFVPAAEFNRAIQDVYKTWKFTSIFLASDSPHALKDIVAPPGVPVIFDDQEQRYNNANHKMLASAPNLADQETQVAYKNIALLSACGGLVGQDNAHFATLAASTIVARRGDASTVRLINGRVAEQQNATLALFFRLKNIARAIGRRLFPHMTMAARMARRKDPGGGAPT